MKGSVLPNHIPVNNYELIVVGLPKLFFTQISGLEQETQSVDMPDRTVVSGGNKTAVEFTGMIFEHHTVELAAMEVWRNQGVDPVDPAYKKIGTLIKRRIDGSVGTTRTLTGLWIKNRSDSDLDLANEGEPAMVEYTFSCDDLAAV